MKTDKKVKVRDGRVYLIRCVYRDGIGDYFKYKGEKCYIYKRDNGTYNAPYFNGVLYIN